MESKQSENAVVPVDRFLRYPEIAEALGLTLGTFRRYLCDGKISIPLEQVDTLRGCRTSTFNNWLSSRVKRI